MGHRCHQKVLKAILIHNQKDFKQVLKIFKRDYAYLGDLQDTKTVLAQLQNWINDYNEIAPHKALKMLSLREYLNKLKIQQFPPLFSSYK
ncbi:hypothetical protein PUV_26830 [Parachlamydia acanthamoebae UV-7]|uniref:Integrase catalytic domain-containing protein n=1 Tax=Parachlamydia acanthamoebae (strain UV7) TaxID=765952 RepID=F8KVB1_PARAV|nr:hypothetical protein PUV_26830 [Parachlamydia acanthamoebae UV-7]